MIEDGCQGLRTSSSASLENRLVTGGAGYIGTHILVALGRRGLPVYMRRQLFEQLTEGH
jgi:hypothetical protein